MTREIIKNREKNQIKDLKERGEFELYSRFQQGFMDYVKARLEFGRNILQLYDINPELKNYLENILGPGNENKFPNFNRYVNHLELACNAARELKDKYDIGIGIAKKGTWLSYVFNVFNKNSIDLLVLRYEDIRLVHALSPLLSENIKNQRVLLYENDLVTGESVRQFSEKLMQKNPKSIDLLLVYRHARLEQDFYEQIKTKLRKKSKVLGKTEKGEIVIDSTNQVPEIINRTYALETDFSPNNPKLNELLKKLEDGK